MENYLSCKLEDEYKKAIAQFRVTSHKLGIETGRHKKGIIPLNFRIVSIANRTPYMMSNIFLLIVIITTMIDTAYLMWCQIM